MNSLSLCFLENLLLANGRVGILKHIHVALAVCSLLLVRHVLVIDALGFDQNVSILEFHNNL